MRRLHSVLIAAAAVVSFASFASAADMPVKAQRAVLPYNWTGWYAGVSAGGDWGNINGSFPVAATVYSHTTSGWNLGAHIGYQYQWSQWVLGGEVGASALGTKGSSICPDGVSTCSEKGRALFEAAAKFGWAWDRALLYGKAGWGGEQIKSTVVPPFPGYDDSQLMSGLLLGAGLEYAVWQNWTVGVEYIHVNLASKGYGPSPFVLAVSRNISGNDNLVRAVLNYRFGG